MADVNAILSRLISSLTVSDPVWDVSVGSATYKILESVANEIAITSNNATLQTYSFDVNSKAGTELDAFVNLFGMSRQLGKRAYGTVTFTISSPASLAINIPVGTQVYAPGTNTANGAAVYFSTSSPATIAVGQTQIQVPVSATLVGAVGNVPALAITNIQTSLIGYPIVSNYQALQGGTDTETDNQLQNRWRNTAFSNNAGTSNKFTSVAQQNSNVSDINVVGAQQIYLEQDAVTTSIVGSGSFYIGLNAQSQLTVTSGSTVASLYTGSFPSYITVPSGYIVVSNSGLTNPSGISLYYDGTNYNIRTTYSGWAGTTVSGSYVVNYTILSGTFTGATTSATVKSVISGLFSSVNTNPPVITVNSGVVSGTNGVSIQFNQPTAFNVITSGSTTVSGINSITSQIPDSKFTYPQGNEIVGLNIGTSSQTIYTNQTDYIYPTTSSGQPIPLKITLIPTTNNAPNTYTGSLLQLQSEYVPSSSRISNPYVNSNFVDIFINSSTATSVTEQIFFNPNTQISAASGNALWAGNFVLSNGVSTLSGSYNSVGDWYIPVSNNPMVNYPAQLVSGNAPSFVTLGQYNVPIALEYVNYYSQATVTGITVSGYPLVSGQYYGPIVPASGAAGSSTLYTNASISGLVVGLVANFNNPVITSGWMQIGTYITSLQPGSPNVIQLNSTLNSGFGITGIQWNTIAYPVYDTTLNAGSTNDITGIAIDAGNFAGYPGAPFYTNAPAPWVGTFTHAYNSDVFQVDSLEQQTRVVGSNVLTHQAKILYLIFNLSVVYQQNVNVNSVNNNIQSAIAQYLNALSFNSTLSLSQVTSIVLGVNGVSSARITTSVDNPNAYGLQPVALDGTLIGSPYTNDILLPNNQVPQLYKLNTIGYGANNF